MIKASNMVDKIEEEINSIMEVQEKLSPETEPYKRNEEAIKLYVDILSLVDEANRKDRELDLKALEEKRLNLELELKQQELKNAADNKLRADIFDFAKIVLGIMGMLYLMDKTFEYEKTGVFTSKLATPLLGAAVRLFLPK